MQKVIKQIADGDLGIDQTVAEMWRLVNRDVNNENIKKLVSELKKENKEQTAKNIFNYVWKNHKYKQDPIDAEQITAPLQMINGENPNEDCDGLVTLLVCLLLAAGIEARIKVIAWRRYEFTHVVAEAKINGNWIILDPTFKSVGWGNTHKIIRFKNYENPMGKLITLEDAPNCCKKRKGDLVNMNNIVIGNELIDYFNTQKQDRYNSNLEIPVTKYLDSFSKEKKNKYEFEERKPEIGTEKDIQKNKDILLKPKIEIVRVSVPLMPKIEKKVKKYYYEWY